MQTAGSFARLAGQLSSSFTVATIDRRGRPPSGPHGEAYGLSKEVEDLRAVLARTGARFVFGLSSGALIALRAAREDPAIERLALYEPPLGIAGATASPVAFAAAYEAALVRGDLATALAVVIKSGGEASFVARLPTFVLAALLRRRLRRPRPGGAPTLSGLIPTMRYDIGLAREMAGTIEAYARLPARTLLLGGSQSRGFLLVALDALERTLPRVTRVTIRGTGHRGAANEGVPDRVAAELTRFFLAPD
jgi:hypothetical protein